MSYCKNVFDWGKHINQHKTAADKFSTADWDMFNAYVIHRLISMNPNHLCSQREATEYRSLLAKPDIIRILTYRGNDDKTIKKLLK